jgi:polar amino acid transport system substrate-binding protein
MSFVFAACGGGRGGDTEATSGNEAGGDTGATSGAATGNDAEATSGAATGSDTEAAPGGKLAAIKEAGEIYMYTNAEFPPYEYIGEGGEIVGVDVEIGKAIAEKLGVELKIENAPFDGIVASIATGKGDLAITGLTITDERKEAVDFSVPYVDSVQYLIVPEGSKIKVVEDLDGLIIGAQTGTTGEMLLSDDIKKGVLKGSKAEVKPYNSAPLAMEDLKIKRIDAVIIDEQVAKHIVNQSEGFAAIPANYTSGSPMSEQYGVGIQKGNEDLLAVVDEVVSGLLSEGKIEEWLQKYSVEE